MKVLIITIAVLIIVSCSQPPDFSKEVIVMSVNVKSQRSKSALYKLRETDGTGIMNGIPTLFNAPITFATVGDTLVFKNNKLINKSRN